MSLYAGWIWQDEDGFVKPHGAMDEPGYRRAWFILALLAGLIVLPGNAQEVTPQDLWRDLEVRARYETILLRNPFQERAFNAVYDSYSRTEGVDRWVEALKSKVAG